MGSRIKNDVKKLFEFWCEIKPTPGLERGTSPRNGAAATPAGVIVESFPEGFRDKEVLTGIPSFAFPCDLESESVQSYSFVHTTGDSKWRFGFCRHDPKANTAMVLITYLPWHDTFLKLLPVLAELRRTDATGFKTFLSEAYNRGVPDSGGSLTVFYNSGRSHFIFERPLQFQLPSMPENHNLSLYYNFVDPKEMIAVFAAMLAERRIIFTSRHLDRLSSCIQAANAFLFPMVWQHIFIPVLPWEFKDYLGAPMPYLIGVPKPVLETVSEDELGEVVILNCDTNTFESPFDDVHDMPAEIVSQLKKHLNHTQDHIGDRISKIFLNALVQLIGGYRDAVEYHETSKTFNHDKFIESRPAHLRPFLAKMMELQIFAQFIDDRLKMLNSGLGFSDEFELETVRYAEKMRKRGRNFLKNVKDKTNPAVKSAVKSVKDGSRGMKTAYKGFKTKLRENGNQLGGTNFHFGLGSPTHSDRPDGGSGGYVRSGRGLGAAHHSAPSSPVTSKRLDNGIGGTHGTGAITGTGSSHTNGSLAREPREYGARRGPVPLAMSSSSSHIQPNGHAYGAHAAAHYGHHLAASPAVSSASSLCSSSEMNLSQELQNHPLFKTPAVDRSQSQQQHHHHPHQPLEDSMNDLISLDDSNNTSFDLEDFDPLNQNARPMPPLGKVFNKKSSTLPAGVNSSVVTAASSGNSVSNPLYPYFAPKHMATVAAVTGGRAPPLPPQIQRNTIAARPDDDFELLRKYGLDQFTLNANAAEKQHQQQKPAIITAGSAAGKGMNNWTTFD
ncbi:DENN domain-containing protein 1A isoform X4 [Drosophila guanche]|uniref:Blast:DENN domain-containing protein 1A n=1 Tax=Drosophila guanche TaxID=7266 RepID=A0A3B0J0Y0_DROGU|nr:DENN domain-containing protein 1A isoform X4 [Drosophila guanche]SPP74425.1 blast:DENN domain-containing protein 1A [Drosophila guanche]